MAVIRVQVRLSLQLSGSPGSSARASNEIACAISPAGTDEADRLLHEVLRDALPRHAEEETAERPVRGTSSVGQTEGVGVDLGTIGGRVWRIGRGGGIGGSSAHPLSSAVSDGVGESAASAGARPLMSWRNPRTSGPGPKRRRHRRIVVDVDGGEEPAGGVVHSPPPTRRQRKQRAATAGSGRYRRAQAPQPPRRLQGASTSAGGNCGGDGRPDGRPDSGQPLGLHSLSRRRRRRARTRTRDKVRSSLGLDTKTHIYTGLLQGILTQPLSALAWAQHQRQHSAADAGVMEPSAQTLSEGVFGTRRRRPGRRARPSGGPRRSGNKATAITIDSFAGAEGLAEDVSRTMLGPVTADARKGVLPLTLKLCSVGDRSDASVGIAEVRSCLEQLRMCVSVKQMAKHHDGDDHGRLTRAGILVAWGCLSGCDGGHRGASVQTM